MKGVAATGEVERSFRITALRDVDDGRSSYRLAWLATDEDGDPVGVAFLRVYTSPGMDHLTEVEVRVHPTQRRCGVGSSLLDAAVAAARRAGRRSVMSEHVEVGSAGEAFVVARGLRKVLTLTYSRLELTDVDVAAMAAIVEEPHPGYQLISWDGVVPDELLDTYTASRRAMDDMPMDETDYGTEVWDSDRVRYVAEVVANRGDLLETVAVTHDAEIVGFTELVVPGDGTGDGQHYGTGVLPEHRGHGLARWMKAESVRLARLRHPALAGLLADTADSNQPMRSINDALGYAPTHQSAVYQLDLQRDIPAAQDKNPPGA